MAIFLVTGGAGSLGRHLVNELLKPQYKAEAIRVLDNYENGLARMKVRLKNHPQIRYFLGDIQDRNRMMRAMENVDVCVHTAAQKHVDLAEYSPFYSIQVNVIGTQNCIDAALNANIDKFLLISSDKSVQPISTYGRCKALAESLVLDANNYKGDRRTKLSICRPPNYIASDGSVFEVWNYQKQNNLPLTVTSPKMTRYFMSFPQIVKFVMKSLDLMEGGEIFVPSGAKKYKIIDLAKQLSDKIEIIGMRKGEKLEELLMSPSEADRAQLVNDVWVIKR